MQQFSMQNFIDTTQPSLKKNLVTDKPSDTNLKVKNNELKEDTFEKNTKENVASELKTDKNKNLKEKILQTAFFAGLVATTAFLIFKNKSSKLQKLPEHIEFVRAKSLDEAIEYGRKTLKIKEYVGFEEKDLDVLNWFNEGVANVANAHKGKLRMPRKIEYCIEEKNVIAGVCTNPKSSRYGSFCLNKEIFDNIDETLKPFLEFHDKVKAGFMVGNVHCPMKTDGLDEILQKYLSGNATYNQKIQLLQYLEAESSTCNSVFNSTSYYVNFLLKNKFITTEDIGGITFEELLNKTPKEQRRIFVDAIEKVHQKTGNVPCFVVRKTTPFSTINHEFGHLQDMQQRVMAKTKFKNPDDYPQELKEWLGDKRKMQIANSVSPYATFGPGEFIAEVFAQCLDGNKLNDDVIKLYKELNGPAIPGLM